MPSPLKLSPPDSTSNAPILHSGAPGPPYTPSMAAKKRTKFVKTRPPEPHPVDAEWRLFLAIRLPEHVRALIERLNSTLSAEELPLRLVDPELAHLTLHFLGQT